MKITRCDDGHTDVVLYGGDIVSICVCVVLLTLLSLRVAGFM